MKLRKVTIKNFRCLVDVTVPIDDTTILIGENNSGKTALLEALRIALPRAITGRGFVFDEYDYHMCKANDSPQTCEGIIIELWFQEDTPDQWPASLTQDLDEIIATDPSKDLDYIGLRLSSKYDLTAGGAVTKWEFLTLDGQPRGGKGARAINLNTFLPYIKLFYLSALRDAGDEFSSRSQFWGRILRALKISEEQRENLTEELGKLNSALLAADPRLEQVITSLGEAQKTIEMGAGQQTSIQALPIKPWELMAKSQVVMRSAGTEVDFPLSSYGQGIQSLAVLFLFQAYLNVLLKPMFREETEAILALEEPEAHLHPQAARAFAASLDKIGGQKIISSHSPHFIQEVPFKKIRLFRRHGAASKVSYIKQNYLVSIPEETALLTFCSDHSSKFSYESDTSTLYLNGKMEKDEYRYLLGIYPGQNEVHAKLKKLFHESQLYLSDEELSDLETYAKRIRGEILFARAWLLCEGQCEYLLFRYFAELMSKPLDRAGVAVIDYQNNGSPGAFVGLAQVFEMPWIMTCDNDTQGKSCIKQVKQRGLTKKECDDLVRPLPEEGMALEKYLTRNGFLQEYQEIIKERGINLSKVEGDAGFEDEVASEVGKERNKTSYTSALIMKLRNKGADCSRVPPYFKDIINEIVQKAAK